MVAFYYNTVSGSWRGKQCSPFLCISRNKLLQLHTSSIAINSQKRAQTSRTKPSLPYPFSHCRKIGLPISIILHTFRSLEKLKQWKLEYAWTSENYKRESKWIIQYIHTFSFPNTLKSTSQEFADIYDLLACKGSLLWVQTYMWFYRPFRKFLKSIFLISTVNKTAIMQITKHAFAGAKVLPNSLKMTARGLGNLWTRATRDFI